MQEDNISLEKRIFMLSKTYFLVNSYFVHWQDCPDLELDQLYQETIPKIIRAENSYDFFLTMREFMTPLNNSHTTYVDLQFQSSIRGNIGFKFRNIGGKWVITRSTIDSLKEGDIIEMIDDETIDDYYNRMKKSITSSGERARKNTFSGQNIYFPIKFALTLENGKKIMVNQEDNLKKTPILEVSGRWLEDGKVAYIKIPSFGMPEMEEKALEYVEEYFDSDTIIIDLRQNSGGSSPMRLIRKLMNKPYRWWLESTNQHYGVFNFRYEQYSKMIETVEDEDTKNYLQGSLDAFKPFSKAQMIWHPEVKQPKEDCYNGNLILLIDSFVVSAAEDFSMLFKDNKRATLVGETTLGSTGQPYIYQFDNQKMVMVGAKRAYFPDGSKFEGVGIKPDIELKPTIDDLKAGKDSILEYVMKNLIK